MYVGRVGFVYVLFLCLQHPPPVCITWRGLVSEAVRSAHRAFSLCQVDVGHLLHMKGDIAGAKARFIKATEISPSFAVAWSNLACIVKDEGDVEQAISLYHKALALHPGFEVAHSNLGNLCVTTVCCACVDVWCLALASYRAATTASICHMAVLTLRAHVADTRILADYRRQKSRTSRPLQSNQTTRW